MFRCKPRLAASPVSAKVGNQQPRLPGRKASPVQKFYGQWLSSKGQRKNCGGQRACVKSRSGMQGMSQNCTEWGWHYDQEDLSPRGGKRAAILSKNILQMNAVTLWGFQNAAQKNILEERLPQHVWPEQDSFPPPHYWREKDPHPGPDEEGRPAHGALAHDRKKGALFSWRLVSGPYGLLEESVTSKIKSPSHPFFARGSEFNIWTSNGGILASAGQALHVDKSLDLINQGVTNWPFQCARKQGEWQHRSQLDQMPPTPGSDANHSLKNQFLAFPPEVWQRALPF